MEVFRVLIHRAITHIGIVNDGRISLSERRASETGVRGRVVVAAGVAGRVVVVGSEASRCKAAGHMRVIVGVVSEAGSAESYACRSVAWTRVVGRCNDRRRDYRGRVDGRSWADHIRAVRGVDSSSYRAVLTASHANENNAREKQNQDDHSYDPADHLTDSRNSSQRVGQATRAHDHVIAKK